MSDSELLHVTFVCTGNICRSPMAEKMFADQISRRGLADVVRVTSAGTGHWHVGDGADERATPCCTATAIRPSTAPPRWATTTWAPIWWWRSGRNHMRMLATSASTPRGCGCCGRSTPARAAHAPDVEDPYYGDHADFEETFTVIEAALPGLHDWVDERLAGEGLAG